MQNLKLVSIGKQGKRTKIKVGRVVIGEGFVVVGGPCGVESEEQTIRTAEAVKAGGGMMFRGGAFKPRTSPYDFQGLGLEGLKILARAKELTGLPIVTEVIDPRDVSWVCEFADILQIGARNMQNFSLLKEVGRSPKPVLLKLLLKSEATYKFMKMHFLKPSKSMFLVNYSYFLCRVPLIMGKICLFQNPKTIHPTKIYLKEKRGCHCRANLGLASKQL